jgi:DNA polymerase-3 subunit epsilon/ATP-dependent DNA helicase DinG
MTSIVSIDIETTGLDSSRDNIIEIGALRFNGHRVEDEWSTLINPHRHIPEAITTLTGIDDAMVRQAPRLEDVIQDLADFIGDSPVLGQNVRFDLGFLQKQRILLLNPVVDTYELASVLMPSASRYNLAALGKQLGIPLPNSHRALEDARLTHAAYIRLYEMALELPLDLLAEIVRNGEPLDWDGNYAFHNALRQRAREQVKGKPVKSQSAPDLVFDDQERQARPQPIGPVTEPIALDPDEVASILEYGGPFSRYFESYEQRPEQVEMLRAITNALSYNGHLMVEAGTGVGKSFAYLVPAALFAIQNKTRVVISTNTINLQDQLIQKDIPSVREALGIDLRAAVLKGRSNYLCPRRLEIMRRSGPNTPDEMRVLSKILVWSWNGASGDRNDLNLNRPAEKEAWMRLSSEDDACSTENCAGRMGGSCPFYKAKQAAQAAHILIVNHALLLSDVATGSKVLPEYQYLIIDEAHHLEDATTGALSFRLSQNDFDRLLKEVGGTSGGVLGHVLTVTRDLVRPTDFAKLTQIVHRASETAFRLDSYARDFFYALSEFISIQREGGQKNQYAYQQRILPSSRSLPGWDNVEISWGTAGEAMVLLINSVSELYQACAELYADGMEDLEDPMGNLSNLLRRLMEAEAAISGMIHKPSPETIYWIEVQPLNNRLTLNTAPLRVGPLIEKYLWHEKSCVVLTSATLTAAGDFTYLRNLLLADEADELTLGSPFDYENSALLYLPNDIPEPNAQGYEAAVNRSIIQTANATGGRMLVLFTSYAQLKRASQAIARSLNQNDIQVYEQGEGASPAALLDAFKSNPRAVLLGTRSFWEGVDVPGDSLSVVFITRIPFEVPSDPLVAARSETFEEPFSEYQVPEAILKFRQGFGRLIRTASDRGIVAILDRRVLTKQYGRLFIESLPQCTIRTAGLNDLPKQAAAWLNS